MNIQTRFFNCLVTETYGKPNLSTKRKKRCCMLDMDLLDTYERRAQLQIHITQLQTIRNQNSFICD